MKTDYPRRSIITGAVLGLIDTIVTGCTKAQAQTQTPNSVKASAGVPKVEQANAGAIRTRKASCACGKLTVTCVGPDPERRSLCHCNNCQLRTGNVFSVQARFPRSQVTIEGRSTAWTFPGDSGKSVTYRSCDSGGVTYHFCPECGSTVYYELAAAPDFVGVKVGCFTDPTFPPPVISGFEEYRHPWAMNAAGLPMKHVD